MPRDWPRPDDPTPSELRRIDRQAIVLAVVLILSLVLTAASALAHRANVPPRDTTFTCTAVAVWDGDGPIWCREGPRIRLSNISARELDGSCRPGAHCVATSGIAARDALVKLLGGSLGTLRHGHVALAPAPLACASRGPDRYGRTLATCSLNGRDVGHQLVATGAVALW